MDVVSYLLGKNASGGGGGGGEWYEPNVASIPASAAKIPTAIIKEIPAITLPAGNNINLNEAFGNCQQLISVSLFDTSRSSSMNSMFYNCRKLPTIPAFDTSNVTQMSNMFQSCSVLKSVPTLNTSKCGYFTNMFYSCPLLEDVGVFDFSAVTVSNGLNNMFSGCFSLTDNSVNNILASCITATNYTGEKTLARLGFGNMYDYYPASRIQALSNYQDFVAAGWSIGY